jgi:hypothetical protein
MFHTLFDYKNKNLANNRQTLKTKSKRLNKNSFVNENYYGKENDINEYYNKYENNGNNKVTVGNETEKFEKTKNKVKLIVYKNGFILNNGSFRDKSIKENEEFLEQVGRGVIPHEIADKGISDLGILLFNRKNETYLTPTLHKSYSNSFNNFNFFKFPYQKIGKNQYKINQPLSNNIIPLEKWQTNSNKNIHNIPKRIDLNKDKKITRQNCSEPKICEKDKKYIAFSGSGKLIRNINIKGLHVNTNLKTIVDIYQPVCTINIRLFNGEVVKCEFNYSQTLRDIYCHIRKISVSNNFYLLDGFPPKPLKDYDRAIWELGLQNSLLTQKIN